MDRDKMDNNFCVLVEFPNEDNEISVGFLSWFDEQDQELILNDEYDEKELFIKWPNVEVAEASVMKSRIKNAEWQLYTVKVLEFGDWTDMRNKMTNLVTNGFSSTSKDSRKVVKKKVFSPEQSFETKKFRAAKRKSDTLSKSIQKQLDEKENSLDVSLPNDSDDSDYSYSSDEMNSNKKSKNVPRISSECSESEDEKVLLKEDKKKKAAMNTNLKLKKTSSFSADSGLIIEEQKAENKNKQILKNQNSTCSQIYHEDENEIDDGIGFKTDELHDNNLLMEYKQKNKELLKKLNNTENEMKLLQKENQSLKTELQVVTSDKTNLESKLNGIKNILNDTDCNTIDTSAFDYDIPSSSSQSISVSKINETNECKKMKVEKVAKTTVNVEKKINKTNECKKLKEPNVAKTTDNVGKNISNTNVCKQPKEETGKKDEYDDPNFVVTKSMTTSCRTDNISHFVQDLMISVFGQQFLATRSRRGTQSGYNKKLGLEPKPALPKVKMQKIIEYAYRKFHGETKPNTILINKGIREGLTAAHNKYGKNE